MRLRIQNFFNSSVGYLPFKIIEGIFGIVSLSLYSHLLLPHEYGLYGIINNTVMLTYLLAFGWFYFVAMRFIGEIDNLDERKTFFSNMLSLQGRIYGLLILIYLGLSMILIYGFSFNPWLLAVYVVFFVGYMFNQFYINLLLYVHMRFLNVVLVVLAAVLKPMLVYGFYKSGIDTIYILFLGHGVVDITLGLIAFYYIRPYRYFSKNSIKKEQFKEYLRYGFPLIGLTLTMYVLNISDRYILRFFYSEYVVGLYVPNYAIASSTFLMIAYGLSRGFYPKLLTAWGKESKKEAGRILSFGIKTYILLGLPAATGMLLLSKDIGQIIIAKEYEAGYAVIGIVAFGMFFLNLADYMNKEWELSKNTRPIFINSLIAAVVNLGLNLILIPKYGLIMAAYTTLVASIIYFVASGVRRKKILEVVIEKKYLFSVIFANLVMSICVIISAVLPLQGYVLIVAKAMIGIVSYFAAWFLMKKILR